MSKIILVMLIALALLLGVAGCSVAGENDDGQEQDTRTSDDVAPFCDVDEIQSCDDCSSGFGYATCNEDRSAFGDCECYGTAAVRFCHPVPNSDGQDLTVTLEVTAGEFTETFVAKTDECDPVSGTGPCVEVPAGVPLDLEFSAGALGVLANETSVLEEGEEYLFSMSQPDPQFAYFVAAVDKIVPITWGTLCSAFVYPDDLP